VANKQYLERLQQAIFHLHKVDSEWIESKHVRGESGGKTIWEGEVEVFRLRDHPTAKRCYAWACGEPEAFIIILELPPVTDAQSAVKVGVADQTKKAGNE